MATIDHLLARARRGVERLEPARAAELLQGGALLIDIRPSEQRHRDGLVPEALVIDRNVLEWRLAPTSPYRLRELDQRVRDSLVILMCNEGYSSSLAAANLRRLGVKRVADIDGGFQAWAAAGLPVEGRVDAGGRSASVSDDRSR